MSLIKIVPTAAFLSFALVACGGGEKKSDKPTPAASSSPAATSTSGTSGTTAAPAAGCACAGSGMKACDCAHCASSDHKDACPCPK